MLEREKKLLEKKRVEILAAQKSCKKGEYSELANQLAQINMCIILIEEILINNYYLI